MEDDPCKAFETDSPATTELNSPASIPNLESTSVQDLNPSHPGETSTPPPQVEAPTPPPSQTPTVNDLLVENWSRCKSIENISIVNPLAMDTKMFLRRNSTEQCLLEASNSVEELNDGSVLSTLRKKHAPDFLNDWDAKMELDYSIGFFRFYQEYMKKKVKFPLNELTEEAKLSYMNLNPKTKQNYRNIKISCSKDVEKDQPLLDLHCLDSNGKGSCGTSKEIAMAADALLNEPSNEDSSAAGWKPASHIFTKLVFKIYFERFKQRNLHMTPPVLISLAKKSFRKLEPQELMKYIFM